MAKQSPVVRAAGALVWREKGKNLEVLLVHRPSYDDWTFPKGKVEPRESVRTCAVREVEEETGLSIVLGQPLSTVQYRLDSGKRKRVNYWAARVVEGDSLCLQARKKVKPAPKREIDGVQWVRVKEARKLLTYSHDRDLLGELVDQWEDGKLDTWTLVLVRHSRAMKRSVWNKGKDDDEDTRPLTKDQGVVRAKALVPVLASYGVERVISSPWKRCYDTVAPYAKALKKDIVTDPSLTEDAHNAAPEEVRKRVDREMRRREVPTAICTHRPVLPTIMEVVAEYAPGKLLSTVPSQNPWLKTGEIMVIHLARRPSGKIRAVAIEIQRPVLAEGR